MLTRFREFDRDSFFAQVAASAQRILMLDYDGTLAPFRVRRDEAIPYPGVSEALDLIMAGHHTRLVIVTGRSIKDIVPLLALKHRPEVWGSHGWEILASNGEYRLSALPEQAQAALQRARQLVTEIGLTQHIEQKPVSIAVHWRGYNPDAIEHMRQQVDTIWAPLTQNGTLTLHAFDGGLELRVVGRDKGTAARSILDGIEPDAAIAFLGDDRTDEDAFAVVNPIGLSVLVRTEERPTAASLWLYPPEELLEFFALWHQAASSRNTD